MNQPVSNKDNVLDNISLRISFKFGPMSLHIGKTNCGECN